MRSRGYSPPLEGSGEALGGAREALQGIRRGFSLHHFLHSVVDIHAGLQRLLAEFLALERVPTLPFCAIFRCESMRLGNRSGDARYRRLHTFFRVIAAVDERHVLGLNALAAVLIAENDALVAVVGVFLVACCHGPLVNMAAIGHCEHLFALRSRPVSLRIIGRFIPVPA